MHSFHPYSIFHLGDCALTIDFGNAISDAINKKVLQLFSVLKKEQSPYIVDLVPAYSSLTVYYDVLQLRKHYPGKLAFDSVSDIINKKASAVYDPQEEPSRVLNIPVCYSKKFALDSDLFEEKGIDLEQLGVLHTSETYRVFMLGFLPGFPYLAEVNTQLQMPRKAVPRVHVDAGSVGIAGKQTGIYPVNSPGGWQIIGRTPVSLFKNTEAEPVLFHPGDAVKFYPISEDEFENYQSRNS